MRTKDEATNEVRKSPYRHQTKCMCYSAGSGLQCSLSFINLVWRGTKRSRSLKPSRSLGFSPISRIRHMHQRCAAWHDRNIIFENRLLKRKFFMRITFVIALLALSATCTVLGQKQNTVNDQEKVIGQTIRQLDSERIQAQISADTAVLNRIYANDFIGVGPRRR
jgi:hypothetical protein